MKVKIETTGTLQFLPTIAIELSRWDLADLVRDGKLEQQQIVRTDENYEFGHNLVYSQTTRIIVVGG
jgi:hypothetical protein